MKTKIFLTVVFSVLLIFEMDGQIMFQKKFGGIGEDEGNSVRQTLDGGYIITGTTRSFSINNLRDLYLMKTDAYGNLDWTKIFRTNTVISINEGHCVLQTPDSGFIITGEMFYGNNSDNVCLLKTDVNGNLLWSKHFDHDYERGKWVSQTSDGGYVITGDLQEQGTQQWYVYLVKTDANGDTLWTNMFGGGDDQGITVEQTTDGGYILGGCTGYAVAAFNIQLIKTDSAGNMLWRKAYGGQNGENGLVRQASDGGYIIAGTTGSFGAGFDDVLLMKTDSMGNVLWSKTYGDISYQRTSAFQQTFDGGYIITGGTYSPGTFDYDVFLIKTDSAGDTLWTRTYGSTGTDRSTSVQQTADSGYIITGYSWIPGDSTIFLIKTDADGNSVCDKGSMALITGSPSMPVMNIPVTLEPSWTYVTSPVMVVSSGGTAGTFCTTGISEIKPGDSFLISPNPSTGNFIITFTGIIKNGKVEIFNIYGGKVFTSTIFNESEKEISLKPARPAGGNIPSGIYFIKVFNGEKNYCRKIIIE